MSAQIVKGKVIAEGVYEELKQEIPQLISQTGRRPVLVSIYVGSHPAIEVYIRSQNRIARMLGIEYRWYHLPDTAEEREVLRRLDQLNRLRDKARTGKSRALTGHANTSIEWPRRR